MLAGRFQILVGVVGCLVGAVALADIADPIPAKIPHGPVTVGLVPVATGLVSPVGVMSAPDDPNRLYIIDQVGQIRVLQGGVLQASPLLSIPQGTLANQMVTLRAGYDERGLLGAAFDPNFNKAGSTGYRRFFTFTSENLNGAADFTVPVAAGTVMNHQSVLRSWTIDSSEVVNPVSHEILRIDKPQSNHNGGTIGFGPDGYLYIGTGDGGQANDVGVGHNPTIGNAQDLSVALGKMLRIDVTGSNSANGKYGVPGDNPFVGTAGAVREVYAYGLRNPYRWSFDRANGQLILGDVGQNKIEEVDRIVSGGNFGWHYKEGTFKFNVDGTISEDLTGVPGGLIDPLLQYDHGEGIATIGGFVYRGNAIPGLQGKYVFGDLSTSFGAPNGRLFYGDLNTGEVRELALTNGDAPLGIYLKGFGEDRNGELYVTGTTSLGPSGSGGVVLRIVPEPATLGMIGVVGVAMLMARPKRARFGVVLGAVLFVLPLAASASVITMSASKDTTIFGNTGSEISDGAGPHMYVGENSNGVIRRGLAAFDVAAQVPAGAVINSVSLNLYHSKSTPNSSSNAITLHRLLNDWGQGTSNSGDPGGSGALAATGDATWVHNFYKTSSWAKAGGDYSATTSASVTVSALGHSVFASAQLAADVQSWRNQPATNFGWIITGNEGSSGTAERFDTRENGTAGNRPVLTVNYTVPEPGGLGVAMMVVGVLGWRRR